MNCDHRTLTRDEDGTATCVACGQIHLCFPVAIDGDPEAEAEAAGSQMLQQFVIAWSETHHATCDNPDCIEPANLLAFLAHSAGLKRTRARQFLRELEHYEANCPGCSSRAHQN